MKITLPILLTAFLISTSSIIFAKSITNNTARGIAKDQRSNIINKNSENDFGLSDISLGTLAGEPFAADNTITRTSGFGTDAQTLCINTPITTITYVTTGATGATVTGLPTGVIGSWAGNVVTISGSPTASGIFNYTVTLTGGSGNVTATGTITVTPSVTIARTSGAFSDAQTKCINTAITPITYATHNTTGATVGGLPTGVSGVWTGDFANGVLTISGIPTVSQPTTTYTITLAGGCGGITKTGTLTVNPSPILVITDPSPVYTPSTIDLTLPVVTAGSTLPSGTVITYWTDAAGTIPMSTPTTVTTSGTYYIKAETASGCRDIKPVTITVTVTPALIINNPSAVCSPGTIDLTLPAVTAGSVLPNGTVLTYWTDAAGTISLTTPSAVAISDIYYIKAEIIGIKPVIVTINAAPTAIAGGSTTICSNGTATVSGAGSSNGTILWNHNGTGSIIGTNGLTPTYTAAAGDAGKIVILTMTVRGTLACSTTTVTDTYDVNVNSGSSGTISRTSGAFSDAQTKCINTAITPITYSTTGATGATFSGLPAGITGNWAANVITISGIPTVAQPTTTYTITLTGGCGNLTKNGTITVIPDNTVALTSLAGTNAQTKCINTAITPITYSTTGTTSVLFSGLPTGVTGSWTGTAAAGVATISGTPTVAGAAMTYTVTLTGGCGNITSTGTITVIPDGTITRTSANSTQNQNIYINAPITNITYATYNATGATITGLPTGVTGIWTGDWANGVLTISGTPAVVQPINSYITSLTGACGSATGIGTITVMSAPVITADYCLIRPKVRLTTGAYSSYLWSNGATTKSIDVDVAGNYKVTVTDATGNSGSSTIQVADELIVNGSFSAGNTFLSSGYTYYADIAGNNELIPDNETNGYAVGTNGQNYHPNFYGKDHTNNAAVPGNFMIVNGHGTLTIWQQTVTVSPNTDYYFSAWAMSLNDSPPFAKLQFEVNGTMVGTVANLTAGPANAAQAATNSYWTRFYSNPLWNSGASTTATIRIVNLETALGGNDFGLDDISFGTLASVPLTVNTISNSSGGSATIISSGQTLNLTSSVSGGKAPIIYSWTGPNGFTSTEANPTIPNATAANAGTYTLQCADYYGCVPALATTNVVINQTMGADDLPGSGLRIYPNPTTGIITIEGLQPDKKTKIELYTIDGKLILKRMNNSTTCKIDISNKISGTYLLIINKQTIKIVKK